MGPEDEARQTAEALPSDEAPRFLLRGRDGIYGHDFQEQMNAMGIEEVVIAPRAPWQNPCAERVIGSTRREYLDHVVVLNEAHLRATLDEYSTYYQEARAHLSLDRNSPMPPTVEPAESA